MILKIGDETFKVTFANTSENSATAAATKLNDDGAAITAEGGTTTLKAALAKANLTFAANGTKLTLKVANPAKETAKVAVSVSSDIVGVSMSGTMDPDARETSIKQYNEIIDQINQLANDASYKGVNLQLSTKLTSWLMMPLIRALTC